MRLPRSFTRRAVVAVTVTVALALAPGAATGGAALGAQPAAAPGAQPAAPVSLSLDEAVALVEERSEAVRVATAAVQRARGQLRQVRSQYFPQLTGSIGYQRTLQSQFQEIAERVGGGDAGGEPGGGDDLADNPLARIFASENTVTLGLQLSQNLYTGGRLGAQARATEAGRRAAEVGVASAVAQAKLEVMQAYFDALLAGRLVAIAESSLVQTERTLRQSRLARQVGTAAEFDLLRAQVTRDNQRPVVLQARSRRDAALLRLRQLLELPPAGPLTLTTDLEAAAPTLLPAQRAEAPLPARVDAAVDVDALLAERAVPAELLSEAVAQADTATASRAPVRQALESVRAQEQLLRATRAQRLPGVNVTSSYQRFAYPISGLPGVDEFFPNWTVSVGLSLPILTGGRIAGEAQEAEAAVVEARARLRQAEELAALDAQLVVAQVEEAAAAYAASRGTAEQATRAYGIAEVRFTEGISTQVELDDARLLLQQALANRAQAARDLNVALARLALLGDLPLGAAQDGAAQGGAGGGAAGSWGTQGGGSGGGGPAAPGGGQGTRAAGGAGGVIGTGTTGGMTP